MKGKESITPGTKEAKQNFQKIGHLKSILENPEEKTNTSGPLALGDYKSFFEALGKEVISSATDAKGHIIYVNDKFVEISQYSREELLGQNHRIVKSGFHPPEFYQELWNTISSGHVWRGEIKNRAKDGSYYWVDTSIAPVLGANGKPEKYVSVRFLITEQKIGQEMLIQSEKMAAVGQLASGIAHEVKNPLGIILQGINYLEHLIDPNREEEAKTFETIKEAVKRTDKIIRGVLNFSRYSKLELQPTSMSQIIEESLDLVSKQLDLASIQIVKEVSSALPLVKIDANQMKQLFINLIMNASQAMPKGGKLSIRSYLKELTDKNEVVFNLEKTRKFFSLGETVLCCEIEDTGIGIPSELLSKVFDPFFTTKPPGQGTGLGLSIIQGIIEAHHGFISIVSEEGKGTTVTFILPVTKGGKDG